MNKIEIDSVIKELSGCLFKNFEYLDVGKCMNTIIEEGKSYSILKSLFRIIRETSIIRYEVIDINIKKKHLFIFTSDYRKRKDYYVFFDKVTDLCDSKLIIKPIYKFNFSFLQIKNALIWYNNMKACNFSSKIKLYILYKMIEANKFINILNKLSDLISVTVVCDAHVIDNIVVQYFNYKKIPTISLQHGVYSSRCNNKVLLFSVSKYLLCYGEFTKKECKALGMDEDKIRVLGFPKLINDKIETNVQILNSKKIGIILDGSSLLENDVHMINIIKKFAKKFSYKIILKFHPGWNVDCYPADLQDETILEYFYTDIDSENFIDLCDIVICCGSTVFLEALLKMKPTFIYKIERDIYYDIKWCKFTNLEELEKLYVYYFNNLSILKDRIIESRDYLTITTNIEQNYLDFYKSLIK